MPVVDINIFYNAKKTDKSLPTMPYPFNKKEVKYVAQRADKLSCDQGIVGAG